MIDVDVSQIKWAHEKGFSNEAVSDIGFEQS